MAVSSIRNVLPVLLLGACGPLGYYQGIGFSGLSDEPASVAEADARNGVVTRTRNTSEQLLAAPTPSVQARASDPGSLSQAAIGAVGSSPDSTVPLHPAQNAARLGLATVNGMLHAVVLPPAGRKLNVTDPVRLRAQVAQVSGCVPVGSMRFDGKPSRADAATTVLDCS